MNRKLTKYRLFGAVIGIAAVAIAVAFRSTGSGILPWLTVIAFGALLAYVLLNPPKPYRRHGWGQAQQAADNARGLFGRSYPEERVEPGRGVKVERNAPCPCGSGKKYKRCCGRAAG
jgi:hypothetical protein